MAIINAFEYVFPVVAGAPIEGQSNLKVEQVYGTSFYIENNTFVVAGHTLKNALQHGMFGLAYKADEFVKWSKIVESELIEDYDVGLVKAEIPGAKAFAWDFHELPMLNDVQTFGYPHALDLQNLILHLRAFKGQIVSNFTFYHFPSNPRCYELSFACPKDLSGAPLMTAMGTPKIKGVIIGNASTDMMVYSGKEVIIEKSEKTVVETVERYESTQFGLAIQTGSIRHIESNLLGDSVGEYLKTANLA